MSSGKRSYTTFADRSNSNRLSVGEDEESKTPKIATGSVQKSNSPESSTPMSRRSTTPRVDYSMYGDEDEDSGSEYEECSSRTTKKKKESEKKKREREEIKKRKQILKEEEDRFKEMEKHAKPLKGETPEQTQSRFKNYQDSMFTILDRERKERQKELVREEQRIFEKKHVNLAQKVISKVERHWSESSQNGQNNLAATNTGDYYEEMNAVRRIMAGHKDEIIDFLYEASSLDGEYYFVTIKDPYFLARKIKTEIHKSENLLTQRGPDYNLKLDEEDSLRIVQASWNEQTQDNAAAHFIAVNTDSPVKDLEEALGLHVISDFITNTATAPLQNPEKRLEELKLLVAKVQTTLNIWNENNEKLPRVAHYFFVVVETIYSACLFPEDSKSILVAESIPSDIRGRALLVGDLLFWLPVHLGDLRTEDHAPRNCLIELSRQLFAIVINGWTKNVSEVSEEEVQMLIRFQLASLRLELSAPKAGPLDDWTASTSSEDLVTQFDQNLREVHQKKNWREKSLVRLPPWKGFQNSMNRNNDI